jgi:hypothetical protein
MHVSHQRELLVFMQESHYICGAAARPCVSCNIYDNWTGSDDIHDMSITLRSVYLLNCT